MNEWMTEWMFALSWADVKMSVTSSVYIVRINRFAYKPTYESFILFNCVVNEKIVKNIIKILRIHSNVEFPSHDIGNLFYQNDNNKGMFYTIINVTSKYVLCVKLWSIMFLFWVYQ